MRAPLLLLAGLSLASAAPSFNVSNVYSSDAVLQRDKPVAVWGWALLPGVTVSCVWVDGRTYASGAPDAAGIWRVVLPPAPARMEPYDLVLTSSAGDAVTLARVLLGDVLLCAGQCEWESWLRMRDYHGLNEREHSTVPRVTS